MYKRQVKNHDVTFGIGPAGTGKTFLAVTLAVTALKRGQVKRIILTRPAVEAGESLGFLPGDLKEKVDPYLRPVYDEMCIRDRPEGAGKTSVLEAIFPLLEEKNIEFLTTREPGGVLIGEKIREVILDPSHTQMAVSYTHLEEVAPSF